MLQQAVHFVTHTYIYIFFQSFQLSWQGSPQFGNKMPIFFWVVSDGTGQHLRRGGKQNSQETARSWKILRSWFDLHFCLSLLLNLIAYTA